MPHNKKLPKAAPRIASTIPAARRCKVWCRNCELKTCANLPLGGTNAENSKPTARPGQVTRSGRSRTRKSVIVRTRIKHVKNSHFTVACVIPYSRNAATNSKPVASSTRGYITEIGAPHARHLPRSHSHANTGTLSDHLIAIPHFGHREPGEIIEISSGIRVMQTFRKLPITIPNRKKNIPKVMATVESATSR